HHEIRAASLGRACIEDLRDVWMVHQRQRLPLRFEARDHLLCVHPQLDDLERDAASYWLLLFSNVHSAEATFAKLFQQLVAVDHGAEAFGKRQHDSLRRFDCGSLHEGVHLKMLCQQIYNELPERYILAASSIQIGGSLLRRSLFKRLQKDFLCRAFGWL